MIRYIIRRLLQTVLVLFLVMTLVFVILRVVGDPAKMMVTPDSSYEDLQNIRRILGLDQPIWKQYLNYLSDVLRGDFGSSYYFERPVIDLLKERLPATLKLGFISLAVSLPLALLFGVISAIKRNSLLDNAVTTFVVMGRSIPTFWFASLMVLIFSVQLKWLPASGYGETRQLIMPVIAMSSGMGASVTRLTRSAMLDVMRQDYITTARAKGAAETKVIIKHGLHAVDVQAIIDNIMGGYGERASTLWRSDYDGYDEALANTFTYDPEKAKAMLAEAGYPNGFDLVLMTDVDNHAKAQEVTEAVGAYLTAIGINVKVQVLDDTTAYAIIVNGQEAKQCPPMFDWNWGGKPNLYESTLTGVLHSGGMSSYNVVEGYDAIIDALLAETTKEGRAPYIQQLQQLMVDDPACLYLFRLYDIYAVNNRIDWNPINHYAMLVSEMSIAK